MKNYIKKNWMIFFLLLFINNSAKAEFLSMVYGETPRNGIFYLPYGYHITNNDYKGNSKSRKFLTVNLLGFNIQSFYFATFINSFNDRVWSIGIERNVIQLYRFTLGYSIGVMHGYHGKLANVEGIPFKNSFLIKNNINPVAALTSSFDITNFLQLKFILTPLVLVGGAKISFG